MTEYGRDWKRLFKAFLIGLGFGLIAYILSGSDSSVVFGLFLWYYEYHRGLWLKKEKSDNRFGK